jgi:hypothetical protein
LQSNWPFSVGLMRTNLPFCTCIITMQSEYLRCSCGPKKPLSSKLLSVLIFSRNFARVTAFGPSSATISSATCLNSSAAAHAAAPHDVPLLGPPMASR